MCRMLLAVGDFDMNELLDSIILMAKDLTILHEHNEKKGSGTWVHKDGWGIAYLKDGQWTVVKSDKAIFDDQNVNTFKTLKPEAVMLHVRWLTTGERNENDTHPFQIGDHVFCHNGTIRKIHPSNILPKNKYTPKGKTDSEELFCSILDDFTGSNPEIIRERLNSCDIQTGSNVILSTPSKSFVAVHFRKNPIYYKMALGKKDNTIIVGSEKVAYAKGYAWEYLDNNDLVIIDHLTKRVSIKKELTNTVHKENEQPTKERKD